MNTALLAASRRNAFVVMRRTPAVGGISRIGLAGGASVTPAAGTMGVGTARGLSTQSHNALVTMYNKMFKSNVTYVTYIVVGCVVIEMVYGKVAQSIWDSVNRGKLYHQIDWSVFKEFEDEDEEEEDEE